MSEEAAGLGHGLTRSRALALARCTMLPGSWDKRFARDMAALAAARDSTISPTQAANIDRLAWKYRRQMPSLLVPASDPSIVLGLAAQSLHS